MKDLPIISTIVPANNQVFPTHDAQYGKGGFMSVPDMQSMLNISPYRRTAGMGCLVQNGGKSILYILQPDLLTWDEFSLPAEPALIVNASISGSGNLTAEQFESDIIIVTGVLTAAATLTIPQGIFAKPIFANYTAGGFPIVVTTGTGDSATVFNQVQRQLYTDGINVHYANSDFNDIALGVNVTAITQSPRDSSKAPATTEYVQTAISDNGVVV